MSSQGPSEEDIGQIQAILDIPRSQAITLLKKYHDLEQAVNRYFEDPVASVKEVAPNNQWEQADNLPSFRIDPDDGVDLAGMSRPPSRVDNRGSFIDLTRQHAEAGPGRPPDTSDDLQDEDLRKAIEMSKQESGVTGMGQQFGPATRSHYDPNQWQMTTIASSREVIEHPPAGKRSRLPGHPAFLRGSSETGYLAPLLQIYHSIPLAREAFLLPSMKVLSYGHDPSWWSGTSDENTKSMSIEDSTRDGQDRHNLLAELQCLMAFLDGTDRAYGSVDALADLRRMKNLPSDTSFSRFLEAWITTAMRQVPDEQLTQIFTSQAMKASDTDGSVPNDKLLVCLEPPVMRIEGQTLVNLLDLIVWDDTADRIEDVWIQRCAEIFTMRLHDPRHEGKGLGVEIPSTWYPDRYMYHYREITREWRREMLGIRREISQCNLVQRRCEIAQGPGKRVIKIREVLEAASKISTDLDETPDEQNTSSDSDPVRTVEAQLQSILQSIEEKVKILEQRKAELFQQMKVIASQLTQPTDDPNLTPHSKYILQGVSTQTHITYIRQPQEVSLLDDDGEGTTTSTNKLWWRIAWLKDGEAAPAMIGALTAAQAQAQAQQQNGAQGQQSDTEGRPYRIQSVSEAEVLEAAKTESDSVVLVYANENAIDFTPSTLQPALRKFVEQDNRAFRQEIVVENGGRERAYSRDSTTTIMDDIPLDVGTTSSGLAREMTPMSVTSPPRGFDGQPSPKRPKSDEGHKFGLTTGEDPPPYEASVGDSGQQMQERKGNKIGILADQLLDKYGNGSSSSTGSHQQDDDSGPIHIEHAREPLR